MTTPFEPREIWAGRVAKTAPLDEFIDAIFASPVWLRRIMRDALKDAEPSLENWQKKQALHLSMKSRRAKPEDLTVEARMRYLVKKAEKSVTQQFNKAALRNLPLEVTENAIRQLTADVEAPANGAKPYETPAAQVVGDRFHTPLVRWLAQNAANIETQVKNWPDTRLRVDTLPQKGGIAAPRLYSPRQTIREWSKASSALPHDTEAPEAAAFEKKKAGGFTP